MTGEQFLELYTEYTDLRQYIVDQAKRRSKSIYLKEEYMQEAWLAISCAAYGNNEDCYKRIAYNSIYSSYWKNYKEEMVIKVIKIDYGRNPHNEEEIWVNKKNPKRSGY